MADLQELSQFKLPQNFRGRPGWIVQLWWLVQSSLFACSPQFMYSWRRYLLRLFGAHIGKAVIIRPSARVQFPWKLKVGDHSWVGDNVVIYNLGQVTIGSNVCISQRSYLCTGSHDFKKTNFDIYAEDICVEDEVWIATDVYVAPGVTISKGCVIGARSSVFKDLNECGIYMGTPARRVKDR